MTTHISPLCPHIPRRIDLERDEETGDFEFAAYADDRFLAYCRTYLAAEILIDETIYDWLAAGIIPTKAERAADAEEVRNVRSAAADAA